MKALFKVLKITVISILSIILVLNIYIMVQANLSPNKVPSVFEYKPFVVLSGSMESKISVGDLVFVKSVDVSKLKTNDIIAFRDNENLVTTHRIVDEIKIDNKRCFKTKGDSNNEEDEGTVCEKQIEGKYQGKIAKIGNIIIFIQKPLGFTVMMLSILIVCILIYFIFSNRINKISDKELKEFEEFKKEKMKKNS